MSQIDRKRAVIVREDFAGYFRVPADSLGVPFLKELHLVQKVPHFLIQQGGQRSPPRDCGRDRTESPFSPFLSNLIVNESSACVLLDRQKQRARPIE